jgi:hypothetical protein
LTYLELQNAVRAIRAYDLDQVKSALNLRYSAIWGMADWSFKHVLGADLALTAGDRTPAMPADFAESEGLYDADGCPLVYLEPHVWSENFSDDTSIGTPGYYTVQDRQIHLAPIPGTATFKIDYRRRLAHVDASTGITPGVMVADTDQPLWSAEYDYALVVDTAMFILQVIQRDRSWRELKEQRDELLQAMRDDLLAGNQSTEPIFWGGR